MGWFSKDESTDDQDSDLDSVGKGMCIVSIRKTLTRSTTKMVESGKFVQSSSKTEEVVRYCLGKWLMPSKHVRSITEITEEEVKDGIVITSLVTKK